MLAALAANEEPFRSSPSESHVNATWSGLATQRARIGSPKSALRAPAKAPRRGAASAIRAPGQPRLRSAWHRRRLRRKRSFFAPQRNPRRPKDAKFLLEELLGKQLIEMLRVAWVPTTTVAGLAS